MTSPKKKKKRTPTMADPRLVRRPQDNPSTTEESGNLSHTSTSEDPSSPSPFQSEYLTPITTPITPNSPNNPFNNTPTSILTYSNIISTHQPSTITITTPTYTTVNTITTTVLVHSPPTMTTTPTSSPTASTSNLIPTSPKLTPVFQTDTNTNKNPEIQTVIKKKKHNPPPSSDIEVILSQTDTDYDEHITQKTKKKRKNKTSPKTQNEPMDTTTNTERTPPTTTTNTLTSSKPNILDTPPTAPSKNIPPIYIYTNKYSTLIKTINQTINPAPTFKFNNQALICTPRTAATHQTIRELLNNNKIEYFTFNLNSIRPTKIAVKYVPTDISNDEIEHDLRNKELPIISISRIMISRGGRKVPSNILILTVPQDTAEMFYGLTDLCSLKVSATEYVRQDIPQCHRCQRFGHSSAMCNRAHRCVRCGESHEGRPCPAEGCKCANCGQGHPASYRGCPAYLASKAKFLSNPTILSQTYPQNRQTTQHTQPTNVTDDETNKNQTYKPAPIPKTNPWTKTKTAKQTPPPTEQNKQPDTDRQQTTNEDSLNLKDIIETIKSLNISNIIKTIKETLIKLKNTEDTTDKIIIIFEAIASLF